MRHGILTKRGMRIGTLLAEGPRPILMGMDAQPSFSSNKMREQNITYVPRFISAIISCMIVQPAEINEQPPALAMKTGCVYTDLWVTRVVLYDELKSICPRLH